MREEEVLEEALYPAAPASPGGGPNVGPGMKIKSRPEQSCPGFTTTARLQGENWTTVNQPSMD